MKQLNGFEKAKIMTGVSTALPKGGYIVKIMDCTEVDGEKNGRKYSYLSFYFDVVEGEYKEHFKAAYDAAPAETRKWKGIYNYFLPEEGSQYYEDNLNRFKTTIANFEESNNGFHWDWDEKKLKGKTIGIIYREKEFITDDGEIKITTEACGFRSVESIRAGKYKVPDLKRLNNSAPASIPSDETFMPVPEAKLPWE